MRPRGVRLHPMTYKKLLRLKEEAKREGDYRLARRIHTIILSGDGLTSGEISNVLKIQRRSITEWLTLYEIFGLEGLLNKPRLGRPPALTKPNLKAFDSIIDSGPVAYGYNSGVWDAVKVASVIHREFGVSFDPRHVRRILDQLGFSAQRPKNTFSWANPAEQARWRYHQFYHIKKGKSERNPYSL